jgi:hypothetical protein
MLSSIHPLGERARHNRWGVTVAWFTAGSIAAGAAVGGALAWVGTRLPLPDAARPWLIAAAVGLAGALDLAGIRAPGPQRQVNERWIGHYRGWVYGAGFGIQLGAGVATFVVSWGVYALFVAELVIGSASRAALIGGVFGLGRSLSVLSTARVDRPSRLSEFHRRMDRLGRPVHLGACLVLIASAIGMPW